LVQGSPLKDKSSIKVLFSKTASINGNNIVITITGNLIEEKEVSVLIKRSAKSNKKKVWMLSF
jgi:hypothetical protein